MIARVALICLSEKRELIQYLPLYIQCSILTAPVFPVFFIQWEAYDGSDQNYFEGFNETTSDDSLTASLEAKRSKLQGSRSLASFIHWPKNRRDHALDQERALVRKELQAAAYAASDCMSLGLCILVFQSAYSFLWVCRRRSLKKPSTLAKPGIRKRKRGTSPCCIILYLAAGM